LHRFLGQGPVRLFPVITLGLAAGLDEHVDMHAAGAPGEREMTWGHIVAACISSETHARFFDVRRIFESRFFGQEFTAADHRQTRMLSGLRHETAAC